MNRIFQELNRRHLQLIGYGLLALSAGAMLSYVLLPKLKTFLAARDSLVLLQTSAKQGPLDEQLEILLVEVQRLERELHGDMANLPLKQMEAYIIGRLQTISWRHGVEFTGVQPREGGLSEQFREMLFDVELHGGYFALFEWLQDIGDELGFVVIKRFEVRPANRSDNGEPQLQVQLSMASYRRVTS